MLCDPMGDLPSVTSYEDSGGRWATRDAHHYACTEFDMEVFLLSLTIVHAPTQHNLLLAEGRERVICTSAESKKERVGSSLQVSEEWHAANAPLFVGFPSGPTES